MNLCASRATPRHADFLRVLISGNSLSLSGVDKDLVFPI